MKNKYTHLIKPLSLLIDLLIINLTVYVIYDADYLNTFFLSYITVFWLIISYFFSFYKIYRYTRILSVFGLLCKQYPVFILGYFAYFGAFKEGEFVQNQFFILVAILSSITVVKLFWVLILKKYRELGNDYRSTVVVGFDDSAKNIIKLFKSKSNFGYKFLGFFSNKIIIDDEYLGDIDMVF